LIRGRGMGYIREASPLFDSPFSISLLQRRGGLFCKRGKIPLGLPLPFIQKERGRVKKEGLASLLDSPYLLSPEKSDYSF